MWRIQQDADGTWRVIRPNGAVIASGGQVVSHPTRAAAVAAMVAAVGGPRAMRALFAAVVPADPAEHVYTDANGDGACDACVVEDDAGTCTEQCGAPEAGHMEPDAEAATTPGQRWTADAAFEGVVTNDGRALAVGTTTFRDPPLPLMLQTVTPAYGGHEGAVLVGFADTTSREGTGEGATLRMAGVFDTGEHGGEAVQLLTDHGTFGVSIDTGWPEEVQSECVQLDDDGWCMRMRDVYVGTPILGLTMTPMPAFASARIWLDGTDPGPLSQQDTLLSQAPDPVAPDEDPLELLLASGAPERPPAAWFSDPAFSDETPEMQYSAEGCPIGVPLTVTDDGRVFGHVATWSTCHTGYSDRCVTPPRSQGGAYAWFRTGVVHTAEGSQVPTGVLTIGTGHADLSMSARDAMAHYDDTGTAWAQVAAGEDEYGIWIAGAVLPGVDGDTVRLARATPLSGDWRPVGGSLEMVAALNVNVQGFPIPRGLRQVQPATVVATAMPAQRERDGHVVAMVAAGMVMNPASRGHTIDVSARALQPLVAAIDARFAEVAQALGVLLRRTDPLREQAAEQVRARVASIVPPQPPAP